MTMLSPTTTMETNELIKSSDVRPESDIILCQRGGWRSNTFVAVIRRWMERYFEAPRHLKVSIRKLIVQECFDVGCRFLLPVDAATDHQQSSAGSKPECFVQVTKWEKIDNRISRALCYVYNKEAKGKASVPFLPTKLSAPKGVKLAPRVGPLRELLRQATLQPLALEPSISLFSESGDSTDGLIADLMAGTTDATEKAGGNETSLWQSVKADDKVNSSHKIQDPSKFQGEAVVCFGVPHESPVPPPASLPLKRKHLGAFSFLKDTKHAWECDNVSELTDHSYPQRSLFVSDHPDGVSADPSEATSPDRAGNRQPSLRPGATVVTKETATTRQQNICAVVKPIPAKAEFKPAPNDDDMRELELRILAKVDQRFQLLEKALVESNTLVQVQKRENHDLRERIAVLEYQRGATGRSKVGKYAW